MSGCWDPQPEKRPTFTELHEFLWGLLSDTVETTAHHTYEYIRDYTKDLSDTCPSSTATPQVSHVAPPEAIVTLLGGLMVVACSYLG